LYIISIKLEEMMPENNEEFEELIKKRDDLSQKLKKLEEKKDSTKEKIFQKVKSDYVRRLSEIEDQLKEHAEFAEEKITELRSAEEELKEERETYADKVEELKLRYELGEFSEDEYKKALESEENKLGEIDGKLGGVQKELETMKGFTQSTAEEEEPEESVEESPVQSPMQEEEETPKEEVSEELPEVEVGEDVAGEPPSVDMKKVAEKVVEVQKEESMEGLVQEKELEEAFTPEGEGDQTPEKEIADSLEESLDDLLTETEEEKKTETVEEPETKEEEAEEGIISEGEAIKEETSKLEGYEEDEDGLKIEPETKEEAVFEEEPEEEGEGLTCPKCHFTNSKDSWYCEKCGAELLQ
jgi:hypothetical protein